MGEVKGKRADSWRSEEDITLVNTILEYTKDGKTLNEAMEVAAERLETRTYDGCQRHWAKHLRPVWLAAYNAAKAEALLNGRKK